MTVPKSKRNKPKTIYLDRGYTVLADMTKLASNLPSHWRGITGETLVTYARDAYSKACQASTIYSTTYEEQARKIILLEESKGLYQGLSQIISRFQSDHQKMRAKGGRLIPVFNADKLESYAKGILDASACVSGAAKYERRQLSKFMSTADAVQAFAGYVEDTVAAIGRRMKSDREYVDKTVELQDLQHGILMNAIAARRGSIEGSDVDSNAPAQADKRLGGIS